MNYRNIFVVLDTSEKVKRFYGMVKLTGIPIYYRADIRWKKGEPSEVNKCAHVFSEEWMGCRVGSYCFKNKVEVTLDFLENLIKNK